MIIRPIAHTDLDALYGIAAESGPGFTSLMPDRDALARKIDHSLASFRRAPTSPGDEHYLFVLEDEASGQIMGTTGIEASVGHSRALYHFRRNRVTQTSGRGGRNRTLETLTRCNHYSGCTEICSLYLRPQFRRENAGKLLSRVRFVFMALHPHRFSDTVIAEMRGVSDDAGQSPFWNWLKQHFVDMEFAEATRLVAAGYTDFIEELMPAHPLYTGLMSPQARAVISQVHPQTRPALHMLEAEGFRHRGLIDLFDAGPTVECPRDAIRSVRESRSLQVCTSPSRITGSGPRALEILETPVIISNTDSVDFRATVICGAQLVQDSGTLILAPSQARALGLENGASCRILSLSPSSCRVPAVTTNSHPESLHAH